MRKPIFFRCPKCDHRLRASEEDVGEYAQCPQCQSRVEIPEPEDGPRLYGVSDGLEEPSEEITRTPRDGGESKPSEPPRKPASTDIWHPGPEANLLPGVRKALSQAQEFGGTGQEVKALVVLLQAGRNKLLAPGNRPLWRPSALCLVRWAQKMIEWLEEEQVILSAPLRRLLKQAEHNQRWGMTFGFRQCALCESPLESLTGSVQVKTTSGVACLCCCSPTEDDFALVGLIDTIWQALTLARSLDPDVPELDLTREALPAWHKTLLAPDTRSYWCRVIQREGKAKMQDLSPKAIDAWLAERGVESEGFLMRVFLRLVLGKVI